MRNARGFTLLETLLAVTLFALVLSSAYGIFASGLQIWRRSQGRMRTERKVVLALEKIGKDLRTAPRPVNKAESLFDKEIEYGGNSRELTLPAILNFTAAGGDLRTQYGTVTYRWDPSRKLICRASLPASALYKGTEPECVPLATNIERLTLRYWIYVPLAKSYSWYDEWDPKEGLPHAVEVTLQISQMRAERSPIRREFKRVFVLPSAGTPDV